MKLLIKGLLAAVLLAAVPAWAHGGHGHGKHWAGHHGPHGRYVHFHEYRPPVVVYPRVVYTAPVYYPVYTVPAPGIHIVTPSVYIPWPR
jgi:hypothetical protein